MRETPPTNRERERDRERDRERERKREREREFILMLIFASDTFVRESERMSAAVLDNFELIE